MFTLFLSLFAVSITLLGEPMDVDVLSPDPAILSCTATGEPTPQFTWTKVFPNGTTVETLSESMDSISISTTFFGENVTSILTIEPTDAFDTANYSCTAENMFGPVTSSDAEVTVFGRIVFYNAINVTFLQCLNSLISFFP